MFGFESELESGLESEPLSESESESESESVCDARTGAALRLPFEFFRTLLPFFSPVSLFFLFDAAGGPAASPVGMSTSILMSVGSIVYFWSLSRERRSLSSAAEGGSGGKRPAYNMLYRETLTKRGMQIFHKRALDSGVVLGVCTAESEFILPDLRINAGALTLVFIIDN